jgi:predicted nucleic acid-binding protein
VGLLGDYVVDASVAVKWVLDEAHSTEARRLLLPEYVLMAPELLPTEVGNVLWKRVRRSDFDKDHALVLLDAVLARRMSLVPSSLLIEDALSLAIETGRTVYDSLYLALAIQSGLPLVTADLRFFNGLNASHYSQHMKWVETEL